MLGSKAAAGRGSKLEVLIAFLRLGATSFGGPLAHIGYFHREFVGRRKWLSEEAYANYVALAQMLPGPASSQAGFCLGLHRAGWLGGMAAWIGFTAPSALIMLAFAWFLSDWGDVAGSAWLKGLKLVAAPVVFLALQQMAQRLCRERKTQILAVAAAILVLLIPGFGGQVLAILLGAFTGSLILKAPASHLSAPEGGRFSLPARTGRLFVLAAVALFLLLLIADFLGPVFGLQLAAGFYRSGALVFGGGHVVLPLLQEVVVGPGWMSRESFLAGYGAAQALPGPLFALSAYLGALSAPGGFAPLYGLLALAMIFLPGMLLILGVISRWNAWLQRPETRALAAGINAAVVGILGAAFFDPVLVTAVTGPGEAALAIFGWALLRFTAAPMLLVVVSLPLLSMAIL